MKIDDEIYKELTDIYWDVLSENKDVARFKDEFFDECLNDGYEIEQIEEIERFIDREYYEVLPQFVIENPANVLSEITMDLN